jgi:hypothetical protein
MKRIAIIGLFAMTIATSGCNSTKHQATTQKEFPIWPAQEKAVTCNEKLQIGFETTVPLAGVHIESVYFQPPCLVITYYYSGCNPSEHLVNWDGRLSEGYPPMALLELMVNDAGDCDQLHEEVLFLDISELKRIAGKKFYVRVNERREPLLISFID